MYYFAKLYVMNGTYKRPVEKVNIIFSSKVKYYRTKVIQKLNIENNVNFLVFNLFNRLVKKWKYELLVQSQSLKIPRHLGKFLTDFGRWENFEFVMEKRKKNAG